MPTALSFATAVFVSLGASGTIAAIGAYVLAAAITVGFTVGVSALTQAIFGPARPKPSDGQQTVRQAVGSRRRHYGIIHTGGQQSFFESSEGTLGEVVTLGTGREGPIIEHRINDKPVTVDGTGTVTDASFRGAVHILTRSGEDDQTAIAELTAKFPQWTADHRQLGCAHAAIISDPVKQKHFSEVYNGQKPQYTQVRHGAFVYDPRKDDTAIIGYDLTGTPIMGAGAHRLDDMSTWEWSENGALVTADYFAHPDGYGGGFNNVNWTNIAQEADQADVEELTVGGETVARWRIWASYSLASDERRRILNDMLSAIDGFSWQDANGKFNLMCGRFVEPDITITDDHVLGMTATLGPKAQERTSAIKMLYTEAATGYREQESATIADPDAEEDPNTSPQAVEAYYIPHHNQAMRAGKILFAQLGDDRWHLVLLLNLYGLNLLGRRFTAFSSAQLGVAGFFKIDGLRMNLVECTLEATLAEVKPEDWEFDAATEEGTPPTVDDTAPPDPTVPDLTDLTLDTVAINFGETNGVAIRAIWSEQPRADLEVEAQYRRTDSGGWIAMTVNQDDRSAESGPVSSGIAYEVRARLRTTRGAVGEWLSAGITPEAAPSLQPPTGLYAIVGAGEATIGFTMPGGAATYARLYGSDTSDFDDAVQVGSDFAVGPGVTVEETETGLSAGTRYYWARAYDADDKPSALAGPASADIT